MSSVSSRLFPCPVGVVIFQGRTVVPFSLVPLCDRISHDCGCDNFRKMNDQMAQLALAQLAQWIKQNETLLSKLQRRHKAICLSELKVRVVQRAIREHWSIEKLIINVNEDMDILGGFIAATDETILGHQFCSGING